MSGYTRECDDCARERPIARFRGTDRICRDCRSESGRRKRAQPAERRKARDRRLVRLYGITVDTYERMCRRQKHRCAICGRKAYPTGSRLVVDHDHSTGAVRDLLCSPCNAVLGLMGEKPARLRAAADYLERHVS